MYKEIIICIVIIVLIVVSNVCLQNYTKNSAQDFTSSLSELKENLIDEDTENVKQNLSKCKDQWDDINDKMAFYIEHDELEKVKNNLVALEGFVEVDDFDTSVNELNKCMFSLEHIADKYALRLDNIF